MGLHSSGRSPATILLYYPAKYSTDPHLSKGQILTNGNILRKLLASRIGPNASQVELLEIECWMTLGSGLLVISWSLVAWLFKTIRLSLLQLFLNLLLAKSVKYFLGQLAVFACDIGLDAE